MYAGLHPEFGTETDTIMTGEAQLSRREQNKLENRQRILAVAARLFAAQGPAATTAEQIAEAAEVSRATFFNYFRSKQAVIAALAAGYDEDFAEMIASARRSEASTAGRLERVFVLTASRMLAAPALNKMILGESERAYGHVRQSGPRFNRMQGLLRELLVDGVTGGDVRTDYPIELLAEMVSGVYVSVLHNWRLTKAYPLEARMRASARFLAEAISPRAAGGVVQFSGRGRK